MKRFALILAVFGLLSVQVASAQADFGFKDFDAVFSEQDGTVDSLAGSHPFAFTTSFAVNTEIVPNGYENPETHVLEDAELPEGEVKDLALEQIAGFVGSQTAVPQCSAQDFNTRVEGRASCPDATAVGIVAVKAEFTIFPVGAEEFIHVPVYNLTPSPGEPAKLGFVVLNVPIVIDVEVNPVPPNNLIAHLNNVPQSVLFYASEFTLWGNPANKEHDLLRGKCIGEPLESTPLPVSLGSCPVSVPEIPFLTLPRACQGPLATTLTADSWESPGAFTPPLVTLTHNESLPPSAQGMVGCGSLGFNPTLEATPSTADAESASGILVTLEVKDPGLTSPSGRAKSDIRKVELTFPDGVTVNPSAAEGLGACTSAQYNTASLTNHSCPDAAKLGTVAVKSPLIAEMLEGSIYLAAPHDNQFGSLIAFYILIESPVNGIFIKQAGRVEPDPKTGQLRSVVEDIPQLPFSRFSLHFREGPRAPLTTPPLCGTYANRAILTPWSGNAPVEAASTFKIGSGPNGAACPAGGLPPFHPGFEAGSLNNAAGHYSPFYMRLSRADGEQDMTRFDAILPKGVTGKLAGVEQCSDGAIEAAKKKSGSAELALPSCPPASQIGRVLAGAGVGSALTYVPGKLYLAGPFAGDPLSVVAIVPAVAGPFDVGTVVTREALTLNPKTAEVEVDGAASEPIPHILEGVPLKLRDLRVYVDRPKFTLNPTSCSTKHARATLFGDGADIFNPADDVPAALSVRYQAASCASLPFKPKLTLKLSGATKRNDHPALHSLLTPRMGDANVGRAVVTLPHSEFIDPSRVGNPCTRPQFAEEKCPKISILGKVKAWTPLLAKPLEGKVYFRANGGERELPDIVADLRGQVNIVLVGFVDSVEERIRTTFAAVPDAPVTKFRLDLYGGKRGLLVNSANLCAAKRRVKLALNGQNGKLEEANPVLVAGCKHKKRVSQRGS